MTASLLATAVLSWVRPEQYEGAAEYCHKQTSSLREQANEVEAVGKQDVADKLRREADNYEQLADNVCDSGLTTEKMVHREHPKIATAMDITWSRHPPCWYRRAKTAAVVGGAISLVVNIFDMARQKKALGENC